MSKFKTASVFIPLFLLSLGTVLISCPATPVTDPEYRLTFTVEGVSGTADVITYTNLSVNPVTDLFSESGAAVPYSREVTGIIDHSSIEVRQFGAAAGIAVGETLTVRVYYEEILAFPPENNRKLIAEGSYENATGALITEDAIVNFALPPE